MKWCISWMCLLEGWRLPELEIPSWKSNKQCIGSKKSTRFKCCGSGMFIPDPVFFHPASRIKQTQSINFFKKSPPVKPEGGHKFYKLIIIQIKQGQEKIWVNWQKKVCLSQKLFLSSEIRKDFGPAPQHCLGLLMTSGFGFRFGVSDLQSEFLYKVSDEIYFSPYLSSPYIIFLFCRSA